MNHPYMFPDQFPGTDDYDYLRAQRKRYDPEHEEDEVPFAGLFTPQSPTPTPEDDYAAWASAFYHHDAVDNDALPELEATLTPPCP